MAEKKKAKKRSSRRRVQDTRNDPRAASVLGSRGWPGWPGVWPTGVYPLWPAGSTWTAQQPPPDTYSEQFDGAVGEVGGDMGGGGDGGVA